MQLHKQLIGLNPYCKGKHNSQAGLNKKFCSDGKLSWDDLIIIIDTYHVFKNKEHKSKPWGKREIIDYIQSNFNDFIDFVNCQTGLAFPKSAKRYKKKRYYDEWQEKNLDGSFAYNGVTEDF